jgi:uncharacterized repeat protein (TIGR02543 family)
MYNILGLFSGLYDKLWQIALLIATVVIIGYCLKYKNGRIVLISILSLSFIVITAYCGIQLNYYYNETGGIYGKIVSIYNPNQVVITNSVSYSFKNLVLTQDGDLYSAKITSDEVLDLVLDENATYGVYVNGMPCNYVEITNDYVLAKYQYVFYDEEFNELMNDTLSLRFAFYTNSTYLSVSSNGGAEAIKYWNNYFNKNIFDVTIDNKGYLYTKDITFGSGDVSDYSIVSYYLEDELYLKQVYKKGNTINLPETSKYVWKLEDKTSVTNDYIVTGNISFYAYPFSITFNANGGEMEDITKSLYGSQEIGELPVPTHSDYTFAGWYTSDGVLITSKSLMPLNDITLYAHWTSPVYNVTCEYDVNTQSYTVTGSEYTDATTITIPSTYDDGVNGVALVTSIGNNAFDGFATMSSVVIPNSITSIGVYAFSECRGLTKVVLPENLTYLGNHAFNCCNNLNSINIPQQITSLDEYVFYACGFTSLVIPSHVVNIGEYTFGKSYKLESLSFEDNSQLEYLGYGAFYESSVLSEVALPNSLKTIESCAFYKCNSLQSITIPENVTMIYDYAFNSCGNLTTMTILAVIPPVLENVNAISSATTTIYIVTDLNIYANANNWSKLTSYLVKI